MITFCFVCFRQPQLLWYGRRGIFSDDLRVILRSNVSNSALPKEKSPTGKGTIASQTNLHLRIFQKKSFGRKAAADL